MSEWRNKADFVTVFESKITIGDVYIVAALYYTDEDIRFIFFPEPAESESVKVGFLGESYFYHLKASTRKRFDPDSGGHLQDSQEFARSKKLGVYRH